MKKLRNIMKIKKKSTCNAKKLEKYYENSEKNNIKVKKKKT